MSPNRGEQKIINTGDTQHGVQKKRREPNRRNKPKKPDKARRQEGRDHKTVEEMMNDHDREPTDRRPKGARGSGH